MARSQCAYMTPVNFQDAQHKIKEETVIGDDARDREFASEEFGKRLL